MHQTRPLHASPLPICPQKPLPVASSLILADRAKGEEAGPYDCLTRPAALQSGRILHHAERGSVRHDCHDDMKEKLELLRGSELEFLERH